MSNVVAALAAHIFHNFSFRDAFEIFVFSGAIYYIQLWLDKDPSRNLLLAFYSYCTLFCASYYADLPVLRFVLFVFAPAVMMLFIILHQEALQKNFIGFSQPALPAKEQYYWVQELIKSSLVALNRHKSVVIVLERNDPIKHLIHSPYFIYAELKKDVFEILLEKHQPGGDYMMWINHQGKIVSINSTWKTQLDEAWLSHEAEHLQVWKQHALYVCGKTDAIVLKVNPISRTFDVVSQGTIIDDMNAEQLTTFLSKQLLKGISKEVHSAGQQTLSRKTV